MKLAKPLTIVALLMGSLSLSGCAALVGAGAVAAADGAAEEEGGNLL